MLIPNNFFLEGLFAASSVFFDPPVFRAGRISKFLESKEQRRHFDALI